MLPSFGWKTEHHLYKPVCLYCYLFVCASLSNTGSLRCVRWVILALCMRQTSRGPVVAGPAGICLCPSKRSSLGLRHGERTAEPRGEVPLSNSLRACRPNPGHLRPVNPSSSSDHTHSYMPWDATDVCVCVCVFIGMWVFVKTDQIKIDKVLEYRGPPEIRLPSIK